MSEFVKVGAGWLTKKGTGHNCVLSVALAAGARFLSFPNKNKKEARHPDIILGYFDDTEDKQQERDSRPNAPPSVTDDDIPF